jgi:hypothetical protein
MAEWEHKAMTVVVPMAQGGWRGAWEAFVAAVMRRPIFGVLTPVTFSLWVKSEQPTELQATGAQATTVWTA